MKPLNLLRGDLLSQLRRLPLMALTVFFVAAAFVLALPRSIFPSGPQVTISLAIVCGEEDMVAGMLAGVLSDLEIIGEVYEVDGPEAQSLLDQGQADVIIEIPDGVVDALVYRGRAELIVKSNDAFLGSMCLRIGRAAVDTMNRIQDAALAYQDAAELMIDDDMELYKSVMSFDLSLIREALTRGNLVNIVRPVSRYQLQIVTLAVFIVAAVSSMFVAIPADRQFSRGYVRRLKLHGLKFWQIWLAKLLSAVFSSVVLCLPLAMVFKHFGFEVSVWRIEISAALLSLALGLVCMVFVKMNPDSGRHGAEPLLGGFAVLLFMLLAGGGFYPVYLMDASLRLFNPAWLAHLMCEWALGGAGIPLLSMFSFAALPALCFATSFVKWRRALC